MVRFLLILSFNKINSNEVRFLLKRSLPMLKKYTEIIAPSEELKIGPSAKTLKMLLNYSRSVEVKKTKKDKVLLILN